MGIIRSIKVLRYYGFASADPFLLRDFMQDFEEGDFGAKIELKFVLLLLLSL